MRLRKRVWQPFIWRGGFGHRLYIDGAPGGKARSVPCQDDGKVMGLTVPDRFRQRHIEAVMPISIARAKQIFAQDIGDEGRNRSTCRAKFHSNPVGQVSGVENPPVNRIVHDAIDIADDGRQRFFDNGLCNQFYNGRCNDFWDGRVARADILVRDSVRADRFRCCLHSRLRIW